jgi:hypothetical protein
MPSANIKIINEEIRRHPQTPQRQKAPARSLTQQTPEPTVLPTPHPLPHHFYPPTTTLLASDIYHRQLQLHKQ